MNILVTGASGLVGNAICNFILEKGHTVIGIMHTSSNEITHKNFTLLGVNLLKEELNIPNQKFDAVVHCAAIIPSKFNFNESEILELNQNIDKNIFKYSELNNLKLIYFSAAYLYSGNGLLNETKSLIKNLEGYYLSKKLSEEYLQKSDLNYTIFRTSSPYGNISKQTNVMKIFSERIQKKLPITLVGKGERKQNFIHIDDISEACLLAINSIESNVYNLTYDVSYTMLELALYIREIYNSKTELLFDESKFDPPINVNFDNNKLKLDLNWQPKIDLKSGLIKTLLN